MSYAAAYPTQAPPQAPAPSRRPVAVQIAAGLLLVMAFVGLAYSVVTLVVTPGVIDRFKAAAGSASSTDVDGYVTVVWTFAALGTVLAVVLFALYIVLALGLRRGSSGSRVATWVVCGLGVLFGCGSGIAVGAQRAGEGTPGTLGFALTEAYPQSWIGLNVGLVIAQMVGYIAVAVLLGFSPAAFFRKGSEDAGQRPQSYVALPTYGSANTYAAAPASGAPASGYPSAAFPASPGFPAAQQPYPAGEQPYPAGQQPYPAAQPGHPGAQPGQPPYPGAPVPSAEDQAFWSRPAAAPAPEASAENLPPGGRPASEEQSDGTATIPTSASAPTPMAPPYAEPQRPPAEPKAPEA